MYFLYSICSCCWNVPKYKWKVHNEKIEIISVIKISKLTSIWLQSVPYLSKLSFLDTGICVPNRQVFGIHWINYQRFPPLALYCKVGLYRIPVCSGLGLPGKLSHLRYKSNTP